MDTMLKVLIFMKIQHLSTPDQGPSQMVLCMADFQNQEKFLKKTNSKLCTKN
jgi:hypothetical protein